MLKHPIIFWVNAKQKKKRKKEKEKNYIAKLAKRII
tara:strand:+ start:1922 stop:2029 length:108 start_codon:yes stop_codon:yes gene_type:complete